VTRELDFNRATAPDIYRRTRRLTRSADGGFELDGPGEEVEAVLEMRRFDPDAVLSAQPEAVDGPLAEALGRAIAGFHAEAEARPDGGGAGALGYTIHSNAEVMRGLGPGIDQARAERLIAATTAEFARRAPLLEARRAAGLGRRCHGDLHLGNILLEAGRPVIFDCIEFNDRLSEIDVQYDLAFTLMDLDFRGRRDAAVRLLTAWLDEAARRFPQGRLEGLAALPLMLSVRAAVRAHVLAHAGDAAGANAYLDAALAHLAPPAPRLMAVGGLSGTGKTTYARKAAPGFGASPGAVVLRTDEIRKRMAGVGPDEPLSRDVYTPEFYEAVYEAFFADAAAALAAGRSVVLDATFVQPALRARAEAVAREAGAPFEGVWLEGDPKLLAARIEGRAKDASDATVETLKMQLELDLGEIAWRRTPA
jgi:aminoglycoside phosphotransferase family enzyme/predicted kinase